MKNFLSMLFSPKRFISERFLTLSPKQIFGLAFSSVFLGLLFGGVSAFVFAQAIALDFARDNTLYLSSLKSLSLTEESFLQLIQAQKIYGVILIFVSPFFGYMAPHLFGGALFIFLRIFNPSEDKLDFSKVLASAAISLTSMAYYCIPLVGPLFAIIMTGVNASRALTAQFKLVGVMKIFSIISAIYVGFFLSSLTLQLLATPVAALLK